MRFELLGVGLTACRVRVEFECGENGRETSEEEGSSKVISVGEHYAQTVNILKEADVSVLNSHRARAIMEMGASGTRA